MRSSNSMLSPSVRGIAAIHIVVKDGAVTLEGSVASESDKVEAFTQAGTVPGVISVTNHLQITPEIPTFLGK
jgi:osmotically-inducible protein OsmY